MGKGVNSVDSLGAQKDSKRSGLRRSSPRKKADGPGKTASSARDKQKRIDLAYARRVISAEAQAVTNLKKTVNKEFRRAVELILSRDRDHGARVVGTGMGKAGIIAQKVCASLASTGTPAVFMHPAEAVHGDLGMVARNDVVLAFSNSGESEEIVRLLPSIKKTGSVIIAITARPTSSLGKYADIVLALGKIEEPCPLRMAPTASTTAMLALGDALALCILKARDFTEQDYARLHPGGALGRKLLCVSEIMRTGARLPLVAPNATVGDAVNRLSEARGGAAIVISKTQHLLGVFTDGDFRRLMLEDPRQFNDPVRLHMTCPCRSIAGSSLVSAAQKLMAEKQINALPVVDNRHKVLGILDIQDLVAW